MAKYNVPFNDTTFFNTDDPTNTLYLVPRASYNWGTIDQTSNIPENVASKNGVMYTGSNRAVGCMALPDNVVEPVLGIAKQGGNVIRLTWNGTAGGVIYTNELDQGAYISQTLRIDETADEFAATDAAAGGDEEIGRERR
jgi:hypothetical protein